MPKSLPLPRKTLRLTFADAENMRALYRRGSTQVELAANYGVTQPFVSGVLNGKYWRRKK